MMTMRTRGAKGGTRSAAHPGRIRPAVTTTYARIGRVVTAAVIATSCAALALGWIYRRRPEPLPVVRCPIHGIAYDAELEVCPDCAKTQAVTAGPEPVGAETQHHSGRTGGAR